MPQILTQNLPAGVNNRGGMKQVQTPYLDPASGKSLHPMQRLGQATKNTLPVRGTAGGGQNGGGQNKAPANPNRMTNPVVMTLGNPAGLFQQPTNVKVG